MGGIGLFVGPCIRSGGDVASGAKPGRGAAGSSGAVRMDGVGDWRRVDVRDGSVVFHTCTADVGPVFAFRASAGRRGAWRASVAPGGLRHAGGREYDYSNGGSSR